MSRRPTEILVEPHWEDADLILMARIKGATGANITQSTIKSISLYVYNAQTQEQIGSTITLTVGSVVFDTLQTDSRWTEDSTGYNFRYTISGVYFPSGDTAYRIEVIFTPVSGSTFPLVIEVDTQSLWSS